MCDAPQLLAMLLSGPALIAGLLLGAAMTVLGLWLFFGLWSRSQLRAERADATEGPTDA